MLQYKTDFHKKDFLKSGSVFAFKDQVWLMWGRPESVNNRPALPSICSCDFFPETPFVWSQYPNILKCSVDQALELLGQEDFDFISASWLSPEKESFKDQYDWILSCFKKGEIEKAVPYVFENGRISIGSEPFLNSILFHALKKLTGFLYGEWGEGRGRLGMTPEVLVEQRGSTKFSTMAVAGTTTLEDFSNDENQFLKNVKESNEHDWVVNDIKQVLQFFGKVDVKERDIVKTPSLVHLRTKMNLEANDNIKIEEIVEKLHPTAALGVFPREKNSKVMGYLDTLNERKSFGAPFGFSISEDTALFVVAIRNVEWLGQQLKIGAGCGVVPESQMENEWIELKNKRESVKQIFGIL